MKRLTKILVSVAVICLLVGVLALAISANSGIDGKFVVKGKGYETWADAVSAADNTHTIYINEDWTLDTGITLSGEATNVKINLNGKTVTVADTVVNAFNLSGGAKLTISGDGKFDNVSCLVMAGGSSAINVEATENGIIVNHEAVAEDTTVINTFRFHDRSTLDVSGFLTVNAYNGRRAVFNASKGSNTTGAAALNIVDAKILLPLPSKTPENTKSYSYAQMISLNDNVDVKIINSDLELYYGTIITAAGGYAQKDVSSYKNSDHTWKDTAAQGVKLDAATINIVAKNSRFFSDYGKYSEKMAASGHNIGAGIMVANGKIDANFDNCRFYADWRPFTSAGNITGTKVNQHQLTFTDCHFDYSPGDNATSQFFMYAMNYKILGGTWNHATVSAGSFYYLPLKESNGNPSGQWVGGYADNVLFNTERTFATSGVTSGWSDSTYTEPNSKKTHNLTLIIDGAAVNFKSGFFSDANKYNSYFSAEEKHVWDDYIVQKSDANVEGGSFIKEGANAAVGTSPLGTAYTFGTDNGTTTYVYDSAKGNGYIKHFMAKGSGSQSTSSRYQQIVTSAAAIGTTDAFVWEWDVSTDDAQFLQVSFAAQTRGKDPRFDAQGNYLGNAGTAYLNGLGVYLRPANTFEGKAISTVKGEWTRITVVVDIVRGELTEIDVPVYTNATTAGSGTVKKEAYDMTGSKYHVFVNGELVTSNAFFPATWGYNGYIIKGYEANYYFDQIRISPSATTADGSYCVDNVRTSVYPISAGVELGLYDSDGNVKKDINGLPHFLVMPNNNAAETVKNYVVKVDGASYETEKDAFTAIKDGSTVELLADLESYVPVDAEFKLITNGYTVPGFVSATHKPLEYSALGFYKLVKAEKSELYTVIYEFNGQTEAQTVAMGTVVPEMNASFKGKIEGTNITKVTGWTLDVSIPDDYKLDGNVLYATAVTETGELSFIAGGAGFETLAEAVAGANGETVKILKDITVDETITVSGINAVVDLNGKTITVADTVERVFNVTSGTLTIQGKGTFANVFTVVGASGNGTVVNFNADGATTGIVINHRTIEDGADTASKIPAFYITTGATVNASGLVTVNAYNGARVVFDAYNGAKALNLSRAKVVVPLLSRVATSTRPQGYSWVISAGDGIAINIDDSELYAIYGQLFHINGKGANVNVSSYKNSDHSWKDSAAQGISMGEASMTLVAKNSRFFSEFGGYSEKMAASGWNPGASFMSLVGNLDAKFDKCTITTDWRGITAGQGIVNAYVHKHQLTFTDCDFVTAPKTGATANSAAQFFMYGANYRILGGTWARGSMSAGSNYYLELKDASGNPTGEWVGGYMDRIFVDSAKTHAHSGVTSNWSDSTYVERNAITCNTTRVTDGVARKFNAAYFGNLSEYLNAVKAHEALSGYYNTGDEATPFSNFGLNAGNGTIDKTLGYVKHSFSGSATVSGYHNLDADANNNANWNYGKVGAYIWEFDVSTDDGYFATSSFGVEGRYKTANFDASGKYTGLGSIGYEATYSVTIAGDSVSFNGKKVNISTEKGDWTRITVIFDVVLGEKKAVPLAEGSDVTIDVVDITGTTMSVYVDGILLSAYNPIGTGDYFGGCLAVDALAAGSGYIDDLRIKNSATQASSICYDNIVFMPISHDFTSEQLGIVGDDGKPAENIKESSVYGSLEGMGEAEVSPVIRVDGVDYMSVAAANEAIKEGSIVELLADTDEVIEINYADIKFINTGYSFKGFVSSAYTFVDFTASRNAKYTSVAAESEIFTIEYPEYNGVSGTQTAVLGSLLKPPAEFDAVADVLNKEVKEYQLLLGWSLSETEDVQLVTGNAVAYPKVNVVKAVVVYWKDANGNVLDTDFYFPGTSTVLDEFDGTEIETDYTQNAYYGVARIGWSGIEKATAGLATSGEYTITAIMGKVAPEIFPGLKYDIAIYTSYSINFYVPQENEGVSDITISKDADGSIEISKFEDDTLDGVAVHKFGYLLGLNATELQTLYLVYNVDGEKISFPIRVSAPTYLAQAMAKYKDDTSAEGEAAKTLMVNFAHYVTKVFEVSGDVDMTTGGAKIYADIVAAYGEDYLGYYTNGASNEKFLAGGALYDKHSVEDLNYVMRTDEVAGNAEALNYVKSIAFNFNSYEPAFIFKFSDAAVNKGLQKPSSNGSTGYYGAGLHVYSGFGSTTASNVWAEKDGNKHFGNADIWSSYDGDTVISAGDSSYTYYAMATNQNTFKLENLRDNFSIRFYWNESDAADSSVVTVIGDVNYNLAAYINSMLVGKNGEDNSVANQKYIEAARALYALSYVSETYKATING